MAALIGYIDAFDESTEQWSMYIERFEQFAETNDVPLAKKVLECDGATTYELLHSLLAPDKPRRLSFTCLYLKHNYI